MNEKPNIITERGRRSEVFYDSSGGDQSCHCRSDQGSHSLAIGCHAYSFAAGNVHHEHEWVVWQDVKLPGGKLILPGVVSHATNVAEPPELVVQRIVRFANLAG